MPTLIINDITATSFDARVTDLSTSWGTKYITWYLDGEPYGWDETVAEDESSSDWIIFEDLEPDTTYTVEVAIVYENAYYDDRLSDTVTTEPDESEAYEPNVDDIYIQQRSADNPSTEIAVRLRGLDEDYSEDDWTLHWYIYDPSLSGQTLLETIGPEYVSPGDDRSDTVTFTGLSPGKTYYIECRIRYYVDGTRETHWVYSDSSDADGDFTTDESSSDRPARFAWTYKKTKGESFNLTAQEWCDLLENINAVREYKGYNTVPEGSISVSNYYNYFTYPDSGDDFLHKHYNQALNGITGMLGYGYSANEKRKGDTVTADCLNLLVEMLNDIE